MRLWRVQAVCLVTMSLACGRSAVVATETEDAPDAGLDARADVQGPDARASDCPSGKHRCDGVCVPETVASCGVTCAACPPIPAFGAVACEDSECKITCDEGYVRCENACCTRQVAAGRSFSCYLDVEGAVRCWGDNLEGTLGDGMTLGRSTPAPVVGLPRAIALSLHDTHACAVTTDGAVYCWGSNPFSVLGGKDWPYGVPRQVEEIPSGATAVATGDFTTCAIVHGEVVCWGIVGEDTIATGPTKVSGLATAKVKALTAGGHRRACALTPAGGVKCWGGPGVGDGSSTWQSAAVDATGLISGVISVSSGGTGHSCAVRTDGSVACWGDNHAFQLGTFLPLDSEVPVDALGLSSPVVSVSAGGTFTCVITRSVTAAGAVQCWGRASFLSAANEFDGWEARDIPGFPASVASVAAGEDHACALLRDGRVACWGSNAEGELGDGSYADSDVPVIVDGL